MRPWHCDVYTRLAGKHTGPGLGEPWRLSVRFLVVPSALASVCSQERTRSRPMDPPAGLLSSLALSSFQPIFLSICLPTRYLPIYVSTYHFFLSQELFVLWYSSSQIDLPKLGFCPHQS